jgi:hypothetical protein
MRWWWDVTRADAFVGVPPWPYKMTRGLSLYKSWWLSNSIWTYPFNEACIPAYLELVDLHPSYLRVSSTSGMCNLPTQGINAPSVHNSAVQSSSPWVELIQPCCGSRACLARKVIGKPIKCPMERFCTPIRGMPWASRDCISRPRLASGESWLHLPLKVGLGRVVTTSPAQSWPRASQNSVSCLRLASGESEQCLPFEVGHGWARTVSPIWCWPQVSHDSFLRLELALGELEQCLPSEVGLGWVETVSPIWGWPQASRNIVSPSEVGLGRVGTAYPVQGWPRTSRNCISHPRLASGEPEQRLSFEVGLEWVRTVSPA